MTAEFSPNIPPTNTCAIAELEKRIGFKLPASYKALLQSTNGGRPNLPAFPIQNMMGNPVGILHEIFGIGATSPRTNLMYMLDKFQDSIPSGVIAIGRTDNSDYICLDLREHLEQVVLWDNRHYWGTGEWREKDIYKISPTFKQFLSDLGPNPY